MSCQQAPRLTEDPYVFTETVSTTPVLFNPQKSRQQQPKQVTQSQPIKISTHDTISNAGSSQSLYSSRFNGTTTAIETASASITQQQQIINGMHKNVISITTINNGSSNSSVPIKLPQPIQQHSHSKIVTTASKNVSPTAATTCGAVPTQVISWNQTPTTVSPPAQHKLQLQQQQQQQLKLQQQPHQQQQQQQQQRQPQQQQTFFTLTSVCSSNGQSLPSVSPLLPPSNFHQNTLAQHIQKVGSSSTNSSNSSPTAVPWSRPQQYSKVAAYPQKSPVIVHNNRESVAAPGLATSTSPSSLSPDLSLGAAKLNHSDINEIPVSVIYRTTPVKNEPGSNRISSEQQSIEPTGGPSYNSALLPVRKSLDICEKSVVFATPAKRDSRVLSSSVKKSLNSGTAGAPNKVKRSQSQTTHHEALQRISSATHHPSSSSSSSLSPSTRRRFKVQRSTGEWHAPDTYIFDSVSPLTSLIERRQRSAEKCDSTIASTRASCVQQHWLGVYDLNDSADISPRVLNIGREERIERHKALLRRRAVQLISSQEFLKLNAARSRLMFVSQFLQKLKNREESVPAKKCCVKLCMNNALALTAQCYIHITDNDDQQLFKPCTAKFADNTQCRIPVFDISHELPLCREHGWKRDNYNRIVQEQKPKAKITRKRTKSTTQCGRLPKRSKKKRKGSTSSLESIGSNSTTIVSTATGTASISLAPPVVASNCGTTAVVIDGNVPVRMIEGNYAVKVNDMSTSQVNLSPGNALHSKHMDVLNILKRQEQQELLLTQDMMSICENSSVYASSEDTGVGGLSESELMVGTQDAEEIPLGDTRLLEEHDLTNVLNNLPVDAFNELFTVVHQDEREEVERALELADKQIKSLQQMTGSDTDFLRDLLDGSDQILDDTDICTEIVSSRSPDTSGIDTNTLFVDGGSNSTAGSCSGPTPTDIRGLVQT